MLDLAHHADIWVPRCLASAARKQVLRDVMRPITRMVGRADRSAERIYLVESILALESVTKVYAGAVMLELSLDVTVGGNRRH